MRTFIYATTDGKIICCKDIWQSNLVMYMGECIVHSKYTVPETALSRLSSGGYTETGTLGGMYRASHFISFEPIVASGKLCGAGHRFAGYGFAARACQGDAQDVPVLGNSRARDSIRCNICYDLSDDKAPARDVGGGKAVCKGRFQQPNLGKVPLIKCWAATRTRSRSL